MNKSLLGKTVRDKSTGFTGRATLYTITEYGFEQYLVEPDWNSMNGVVEGRLYEIDRLEEVNDTKNNDHKLIEENRGMIFR